MVRLDREIDGVVAVRIDDGLVTGLYFVRNSEKLPRIQRETAVIPELMPGVLTQTTTLIAEIRTFHHSIQRWDHPRNSPAPGVAFRGIVDRDGLRLIDAALIPCVRLGAHLKRRHGCRRMPPVLMFPQPGKSGHHRAPAPKVETPEQVRRSGAR